MYKTIVVGCTPKAAQMAEKIEAEANRMSKEGYELVTSTITLSAKAILVFKKK